MRDPDLGVVDVETTGFAYTQHDRIVEIAIVRTDFDGNAQTTFDDVVKDRMQEMVESNFQLYKRVAKDDAFRKFLFDWLFERYRSKVEESASEGRSA